MIDQYETPHIEYTESIEALLTFCKKKKGSWKCEWDNKKPGSGGGGYS